MALQIPNTGTSNSLQIGVRISMRNAFVKTLSQLASEREDILLMTGDLGFGVFDEFKEKFPSKFLNAGVAESNMIGMAAGLALNGFQVFTYSIAPFLVYRAFEQIRDDLCYQNLPVKIVGVGGGLAYGNAGPSHHATEDIALMSSLPNMTVLCPGDPIEAAYATKEAIKLSGPVYIRLNRSGDPVVHNNDRIDFQIGKAIVLEEGNDILIISTGNTLHLGALVRKELDFRGFSTELISVHTVKPFDKDTILRETNGKKLVVSIEEHTIFGGLSSTLYKTLFGIDFPVKFLPITLPDKFVELSASQNYLRDLYELNVKSIVKSIIQRVNL